MLAWPPVFNSFIRSYGGELMSVDGKPTFNSEGAKKGLLAMKELIDKRYTIIPTQKTEEIFNSGKAVMYFAVRPILSNLEAAGLDYDVVSFPKIGEIGYIGAGTSGYGISRSTKHANEAWAFLAFMMSEDGQQAFSKSGNAVPVLKTLATADHAIWRTIPDAQVRFNHNAFIAYPERDTLKDYLNGVNVDLYAQIDSAMLNLIDRCTGWSGPAENIDDVCADVTKNINKIINSD
jgi:ABC-type glycerol-3-phosphate transport system substrate-binding protein